MDNTEMKRLDALVRRWTGWDSMAHMARGVPTLRPSEHNSDEENDAIMEMRIAYREIAGKDPYPAL